MATYRRRTTIAAPLDTVWDFHSHIEGLTAVTPGWLDLRVEAIRGPDGEPRDRDATLVEGTAIDLSMQPVGVGPRTGWTSRIERRESDADTAMFVDSMTGGPFAAWEHTHRFERVTEGTRLIDEVAYRLPPGGLGAVASPLAVVGLDPMFRYRHRQTKRLLEARAADADGPDE
jgi:ligand-binding SRPBCC domain-containing protein